MNFSLLNVDGRMISLDDYPEAKGYIVIFICNHCPYAVAYESRLIALHDLFSKRGFPVIAINPNDADKYPQDSYDQMIARAADREFHFPYLYDESQNTAHTFGAKKTPHAFVLDGKREVVYNGAIDDNYENASAVSRSYIQEVVTNLLEEKEAGVENTNPVGCGVKWKAAATQN